MQQDIFAQEAYLDTSPYMNLWCGGCPASHIRASFVPLHGICSQPTIWRLTQRHHLQPEAASTDLQLDRQSVTQWDVVEASS